MEATAIDLAMSCVTGFPHSNRFRCKTFKALHAVTLPIYGTWINPAHIRSLSDAELLAIPGFGHSMLAEVRNVCGEHQPRETES